MAGGSTSKNSKKAPSRAFYPCFCVTFHTAQKYRGELEWIYWRKTPCHFFAPPFGCFILLPSPISRKDLSTIFHGWWGLLFPLVPPCPCLRQLVLYHGTSNFVNSRAAEEFPIAIKDNRLSGRNGSLGFVKNNFCWNLP